VAAFRSRELTTRGVQIFHAAATADGADRSGLTALTYAVMGNYAVDAALAVALANTLFFAAATAESTGKVLLYLLITVAPFAVIAPLIGPALDKLQHGRRIALGASSFARAVLAVVMALNFDSWVLYPCALGMLVLSKSFSVLKAAITPRVLPPDIKLVKTNSRLSVFGLMAGGVAGALAAGLSWAFGSTGALILTGLLSVVGGLLCLRIPSWVESTAGEIPVDGVGPKAKRAFPLSVTTTLWANGTIRVETGFLALFVAFVIKREYTEASAFTQLLLLGVVGVAAGIGGFIGNGLGAKLALSKPETVSIWALAATATTTLIAVLIPSLATAALVGLVGSTASSLAKVCLDSVIQHELPEASRASAFGLSETVLQLSWVFGGVIGLLIGGVWTFGLDSVFSIGFAVITVLLVIGLIQSWLVRSGRSLFPWLDYSKLTRHFRRSGKGAAGTTSVASPVRDAGRPATGHWIPPPTGQPPTTQPPTTQMPWQPGGSGQAWQNAPPTGGWSYPPAGYGPPTGAQPPQQPPGYPTPGYQAPGRAPDSGSGQPPQQQPHPPPRDAGRRRKWSRGQ
jgi:MFS family permease